MAKYSEEAWLIVILAIFRRARGFPGIELRARTLSPRSNDDNAFSAVKPLFFCISDRTHQRRRRAVTRDDDLGQGTRHREYFVHHWNA